MSLFVTFEGTEGSGKSTQVELLARRLGDLGYHVVSTREPGGTALGEALREILLGSEVAVAPESEAYLMTAARSEHVRQVIRPALDAGAVVLCDRFVDSTLAYQGAGRGLPVDELRRIQSLAIDDVWPDLTILLDLAPEEGLGRRASAGGANRIDREGTEFHRRVADWFRQEATRDPDRWAVVDALPAASVVHEAVAACVLSRLCPGREARL